MLRAAASAFSRVSVKRSKRIATGLVRPGRTACCMRASFSRLATCSKNTSGSIEMPLTGSTSPGRVFGDIPFSYVAISPGVREGSYAVATIGIRSAWQVTPNSAGGDAAATGVREGSRSVATIGIRSAWQVTPNSAGGHAAATGVREGSYAVATIGIRGAWQVTPNSAGGHAAATGVREGSYAVATIGIRGAWQVTHNSAGEHSAPTRPAAGARSLDARRAQLRPGLRARQARLQNPGLGRLRHSAGGGTVARTSATQSSSGSAPDI